MNCECFQLSSSRFSLHTYTSTRPKPDQAVEWPITKNRTARLKKALDPAEYGGAPFLGLAKPVIKAHGGSDSHAFCSAVKQAVVYSQSRVIEKIARAMAKEKNNEEDPENAGN